jgi:hypothetical protein
MYLKLLRTICSNKYSAGVLSVFDEKDKLVFSCNTLELPWKENQHRISCIPVGWYQISRNNISKFGKHLYFKSVPNRQGILIHAGNFTSQILGCILVGKGYSDLNKDGIPDILNSRQTIDKLYDTLKDYYYDIEIYNP